MKLGENKMMYPFNGISNNLKPGRRTLREPALFTIIIISIIISIAIFASISVWIQQLSFDDIVMLDVIKCQQQIMLDKAQNNQYVIVDDELREQCEKMARP